MQDAFVGRAMVIIVIQHWGRELSAIWLRLGPAIALFRSSVDARCVVGELHVLLGREPLEHALRDRLLRGASPARAAGVPQRELNAIR